MTNVSEKNRSEKMKVLEEAVNRNRGDYTLLEERVREISAFETKTDEGKKSKHEAIEKLKSSMKVLDENWQTQLAQLELATIEFIMNPTLH